MHPQSEPSLSFLYRSRRSTTVENGCTLSCRYIQWESFIFLRLWYEPQQHNCNYVVAKWHGLVESNHPLRIWSPRHIATNTKTVLKNWSLSSGATNLICTSSLASDVLCNVFLNDIEDIRTLQFEKMSEKDSNLHEMASSSSRGLIGVEPKRHWSTLRWCLNLSPYSSITQIGRQGRTRTYVVSNVADLQSAALAT